MIYIFKGNVPAVFCEIKMKYNHYDELSHDDKERLKSYLISEQGRICAYCMCRIKSETSTIEHYNPRSLKPELSLDYNNLLAVCTNGRNDTERDRQCDVSRGDVKLNLNPCREHDMKHIMYKKWYNYYSKQESKSEFVGVILFELEKRLRRAT